MQFNVTIFENQRFPVASHGGNGADIATIPYKVIEQMTKHPLTDQGIEKFQADYKAVFGE